MNNKFEDNKNKRRSSGSASDTGNSWNELLSDFQSDEDEEITSLADLGLESDDMDFSSYDPFGDSSGYGSGGYGSSGGSYGTSPETVTFNSGGSGRSPVSGGNIPMVVDRQIVPSSAEDRRSSGVNNSDMADSSRKRGRAAASGGNVPPVKSGKKKKKKKRKKRGIFRTLLLLLLILIIMGLIYTGYVILTTPAIEPDNIYEQLTQSTIIYDDQEQVLEAVSTKDMRTNIDYEDIPQDMKDAIVAIEDKTFFDHHGFNFVRIIGAIGESITSKGKISGTSTITQQLARNIYLSNDRTMTRKIREAYYTVILEHELTKEQILEAYLNTIYLGYGSNGIQTAAQSYFGCDAKDLSLAECSVLASLPKNPNGYAPLKRYETEKVEAENPNIILQDATYTTLYDDKYKSRQQTVLKFMLNQDKITQQEYDEAMAVDIKAELHPSSMSNSTISSYFGDYCVDEVINDLQKELRIDKQAAQDMVYNRGLKIHSTINIEMQKAAEKEFANSANFPSVRGLIKDNAGNIMNDSRTKVLMYAKNSYFNQDGTFTLAPDEFTRDAAGNLVILKGKRLNIYSVTGSEGQKVPQIEFKSLYTVNDGILYSIDGGFIKGIEEQYLSKDADGNAVVSAEFLNANPDFFIFGDSTVSIGPAHYTLRQETIQPQGAMVATDHATGQIKIMVGGRSVSGRLLFNRADNPRQPGSSIKPIGVYGPAIQSGVELGTGWTAGSTIEDSQNIVNGKVWPKNWNNRYSGWVTLRYCVQQSLNVPAVRLLDDIGTAYSTKYLKANGISTIVESGDVNDMNAAALALGGMSKGISPLEMAAAYGTFANGGMYIEPSSYTKVMDARGNVLLEKKPETHRVYDEGVAFIMTDILRTTVTNGIAKRAAIGNQPVAGKTGTTTENCDAWFVGFTPQLAASVWIGNDVNIELSSGSGAAASLWSKVMNQACAGFPYGAFKEKPENVITIGSEYYVEGTKPKGPSASSGHSTEEREILYDENGKPYYIKDGKIIYVNDSDQDSDDDEGEQDNPEKPDTPVTPPDSGNGNGNGGGHKPKPPVPPTPKPPVPPVPPKPPTPPHPPTPPTPPSPPAPPAPPA